MAEARASGATVLPVDSEHSAMFQALVGEDMKAVERVIITASGGAFRDWPAEKLATATLAEASSHPNWAMGQRITIDSRRLFNKALELIETREYFGDIARPDRGGDPPRVHRPRAGGLHRRRDDGASGAARHAPCHRLCAELAGPPPCPGGAAGPRAVGS
jgi:hypothetical protein